MTSVVLLLLVLFFVLVNGYFVGAEFAIVRTRASRMQNLADEGDRRAEVALRQLDHVDEYVATSQVGITLASLAIGFLGEPGVQDHLKQHVAQLGLQFGVAAGRLDGLRDLVGLLQEVLHEGFVGEGTHPGAMLAQGRNGPQQLPHLASSAGDPCRCGPREPLDGFCVLVSQGRRRPR